MKPKEESKAPAERETDGLPPRALGGLARKSASFSNKTWKELDAEVVALFEESYEKFPLG